MQKLILAQVKWPEEVRTAKREAKGDPLKLHDAAEKALSSSWYECQYCGGLIDDSDKLDMLRKGEWRDDRATATPPRHVAFHLSSIYSPFVSFGQVASEFLQSEEFPDRLRNFINSWLGEPWRDTRVEVKGQELLAQEGNYHLGEVPAEAHFLTAAVDVQLDHFWWKVVAWGVGASSWIVDFGRAESWENLEDIIVDRQYPVKGGGLKQVRMCGVDSGYRADEVYQWCTAHSDVAKPVKGASQSLGGRFYSVSSLDKEGWAGLKLLITDTDYWKDYIFGRLRRTPGSPGAMHVPQNCPEYWAAHMTSEQKTVERNRKTGKEREVWVKISQHAPNHLLDCLVYSALMAELCGVRYLSDVQDQRKQHEVEPERPTGSWLGNRKSWLHR